MACAKNKHKGRVWLLTFIFVLMLAPVRLVGHPGFCKLTLFHAPVLTIDPTCTNCDGGSLDIYLRNDNSGPVPLLLTAGNLIDKTSKTAISAGIVLQPLDPCSRKAFTSPQLEHGSILLLRVVVSHVLQEGRWEAELYNRGVELGSFTVVRAHLPFNISLSSSKPDAPEIYFKRGSAAALTLSNADANTYPANVKLVFKGQSLDLGDVTLPPGGSATLSFQSPEKFFDQFWLGVFKDEISDGQLVVSLRRPSCPGDQCPLKRPNNDSLVACSSAGGSTAARSKRNSSGDPSSSGTSGPASAAQGDVSQQSSNDSGESAGQQSTTNDQAFADAPTKVIRASVHLAYFGRGTQFFWIFGLLALGALCSLFLSAYVPNQLQRIRLKKQLDGFGTRVRDLPMTLASRIRVSVGLEEKRLSSLLDSALAFLPGFSAVVDEVNSRIGVLQKRLVLVEQMGTLRQRFDNLRAQVIFPTPMNKITDGFEGCVDVLRKIDFSDDDRVASQNVLRDLNTQINNLEDIELFYKQERAQVDEICKRAKRRVRSDPPEYLSDSSASGPRSVYQEMRKRLEVLVGTPRPLTPGAPETPASIQPKPAGHGPAATTDTGECTFPHELLPDVDRLTVKMEMLDESMRLLSVQKAYEKAKDPNAATMSATISERSEELAVLLDSQNPEKFEAARRLLQEIKEQIFTENIEDEIRANAKAERIRRPRDWGTHVGWVRVLILIVWINLVVWLYRQIWSASSFNPQPIIWLGVVTVIALWLLLARDLIARTLRWFSRRLDRESPRYVLDPLTGDEVKVLAADPRQVHIQQEISTTRVYEAAQLRVRFCKEQFNASTALQDITPIWDFGHGNLTPEEGWEVMHYFPRPAPYLVKVKFQRRLGGFLSAGKNLPTPGSAATTQAPDASALVYVTEMITAEPAERSATFWDLWLNVIWLLVALVPVLLALYAGAIDQLNKLDPIPGLIAIFMAGFTSDQVKNLLTQKAK